MPNSGYAAANHPFHHYLAVGPASLLELVLPLLLVALFFLLIATGRWGAERAKAEWVRRKDRASSRRAVVTTAPPGPPMLASDLERDQTATLISQAVAEGRLSIEEGLQRIDAVLHSRHRHQLADHVADLPSPAQRASARPLDNARQRLGSLPIAAVVVLAAVLVQVLAGLWEVWPLAVVAVGASPLLIRR